MIGKAEWFTRRKWAGWGLFPVTWQGWIYMVVIIVAIFGTQFIPADQTVRMGALGIVAVLIIVDTVDMMARMKKDERETMHEALAERNALWAIILVLAAGAAFEAAQSVVQNQKPHIDPVIIVAIVAGLIVKAASNYYLDKRN